MPKQKNISYVFAISSLVAPLNFLPTDCLQPTNQKKACFQTNGLSFRFLRAITLSFLIYRTYKLGWPQDNRHDYVNQYKVSLFAVCKRFSPQDFFSLFAHRSITKVGRYICGLRFFFAIDQSATQLVVYRTLIILQSSIDSVWYGGLATQRRWIDEISRGTDYYSVPQETGGLS